MSEFHREDESCDFHFGAPSFKLVSVGEILGGEGAETRGRRSQFLLLIFTLLTRIKSEET